MFGLDSGLLALLLICLACACLFEFINGFHDTANAVATVIYTGALKPTTAVILSGVCNFVGVFAGGITVAMGIVNLLPVDTLVDPNIHHSVGMVLALLLTAIFWNFATWYLAIPCSSSHTLIGSILGVGLGYSLLPEVPAGVDAVNWKKAGEIGMSLLISPLFGFSLSIFLMFFMRRMLTKKSLIFKEPVPGQKPPTWIRSILILTCTGVSFTHGSNDGQKGVGLMMLILIGIVPGYFAIDHNIDVNKLKVQVNEVQKVASHIDASELKKKDSADYIKMMKSLNILNEIASNDSMKNKVDSAGFLIRKHILLSSKSIDNLLKSGNLSLSLNKADELKKSVKGLKSFTDYAPWWVVLMISVSLGLGTVIGWKRIVITVGEKIGKQNMNYAQGSSAGLVAASTIGVSTWLGLPVSTTHVLSSGVAGSMVASKGIKNLQAKTIRNILIAWVLTLPVCMTLAGLLFWLFRYIL